MTRKPSLSATTIRIAQAHRPIFYLPHMVADAVGAFKRRSLAIEVIPMETGDQWRMLTRREADIAIGGPMRSMRLYEEGRRMVTFAAAVSASPWVVVGPPDASTIDDVRAIAEYQLLDDPEIATGRLCLRGLLVQAKADPTRLSVSMRTRASLVAGLGGGRASLALLPREAVVDPVRRGLVRIVVALGMLMGPVPWSTYQTLPEVVRERRSELTAFSAAITEALQAIQEAPIARLAEIAQRSFPAIDGTTLQAALYAYRAMGVWPTTPEVPRVDFDRLAGLLVAAGWLHSPPPYDELVLSLA